MWILLTEISPKYPFSIEFSFFLRKACAFLYLIQIIEIIILSWFLWQERKRLTYRAISIFLLTQSLSDIYLVYLLSDYSPVRPVQFAFLPLAIGSLLTNVVGIFTIKTIRREVRMARKQ